MRFNFRPQLVLVSFFSILALFMSVVPAHAQEIKDLFEQAGQYFYEGKYDKAISNYERIIELQPNFAPAYNALGLVLKVSGAAVDEAAFYFKKATELDPNFIASYDNLGKLYYAAGDLDAAENYFKKGLELEPDNESMKLSMGWIYLLGRGEPDKAMKYFKAVVAKGNSAMGYFGQGICYMSNGKRMEVMDIVTKLRQINQEGLALDLETMLRENRSLIRGPEMPSASSIKTAPKNEAPAPSSQNSGNASNAPYSEYNDKGEFQVRLRGKLPPK